MNPQHHQQNLQNPTNGIDNQDSFVQDDFQHQFAQVGQKREKQSGQLTPSQIYSFQSQMLAYKYLIRNVSIPKCVAPNTPGEYTWEAEKEAMRKKSILYYKEKVQKEQELRQKMISKMKPQQQENQMRDQEKAAFLVEKRKQDIAKILEKDKNQKLAPEIKQRLQIELRFLDCREYYLNLIDTLIQGIKKNRQSAFLIHRELLDRNFFRISKNSKTGQANKSQNVDKILMGDQQRKKKIKHLEFMRHLKTHRNNFFLFHQNICKNHKKINFQLDITFKNKKKLEDDKKEQKDRELKEAMQAALKQNDMTEFFRIQKLLKSSKIHELLEKTNRYLKDLGAKVMLQKGQNDEKNVPVQLQINEGDNQNIEETFNNANKYYYSLTHTVKEKISEQSTLIVGGKLKEYQLTGVQWMLSLYNNNLNGILADEMGLGKTIQTIALLCHLVEVKKNFGPFLIVLPLSTLSNWKSQFHKWSPSLKVVIYRGNKAQRSQVTRIMKSNKWNVCLTTYEYILKDRKNLTKYDWKYIIVDEGHKMKNSKSKFVNVLGQQYSSCHRLLLTGTPLQNNLVQLWSLLNFLLPKVFNNCDDFSQWFAMAMNKKSTNPQNTELELTNGEKMLLINRLQQVLRPFLLRRVKKQVLKQLPEKVEHVIKIPLSAWQHYIYSSVTDKNRLQLNGKSGKIRTTSLTNTLIQLRKCCNHPYLFLHDLYTECQPQWVITASGKVQVLDRILPKLMRFGHKVLIFTQMTRVLDVLSVYFNYKFLKFLRLDGGTKSQQRAKITELFNSPHSDYSIFILSTRAGGLGLNLQAADTVIIFDSDWNPQMDLQAQDRAHRLGQQNKVVVLRFISNMPVEQNMYQTSLEKKNIDEVLIQGGLYNLKSNEDQRRKKLQDALKLTQIIDEKKSSQIHNSHSINKMLARDENQFKVYQEMDQQYRKNFEDQGKNRLMTDQQIPKWFSQNSQKVEIKQYGRGNRVHNSITYYDDQMIYEELLGQKIYEQDSKSDQEPVDVIQNEDQPSAKS